MTDIQIKLVIGSLLHDIGKVAYRTGDGRNHSESGYDFLKRDVHISDTDILDCVRYHHKKNILSSKLANDSIAYITYIADNIAAAADRRVREDSEDGFDKSVPLASVFNILNGNNQNMHYKRVVLDADKGINYPTDESVYMDEHFYSVIIDNISDNLRGIDLTDEYVNSLLTILEANLSYVPSSTSKRELMDISLFDHVKTTAAIAQCIYDYIGSGEKNYKEIFLDKEDAFYSKKAFLLYSLDISGIQSFIYTISTEHALKSLRSRSFYLDILMEHIVDEILVALNMSRANLIYSGGGHCYLILPNTLNVKRILSDMENEINSWFLKNFDTSLYMASGYAECSADDLKNEPEGSYKTLYLNISEMISKKKTNRYSPEDILRLNSKKRNGERECKVCRRSDSVDEDGRCFICSSLEKISPVILRKDIYFTVSQKPDKIYLPLPFGKYLFVDTEDELRKHMEDEYYVRCYTKNRLFTGKHVTTKIWVGDYTTRDSFEEFADKAEGVKRIGVLRADVDNLGTTIISGFKRHDGKDTYSSLSRTAAFSRMMSLFFKCYINRIAEEGCESHFKATKKRNATIIYSGGDDLFIVGSWNDIISFFVDLKNSFEKFVQGTMTISGGVGLYDSGYPANLMALETGRLENAAKANDENTKDSIALFSKENGVFKWREFVDGVIGEKFEALTEFFDNNNFYGKAFIYNMLELLRNSKARINRARLAYVLSRMEPEKEELSDESLSDLYKKFSEKIFKWYQNSEDRKELIMAIYIYVYLNREVEKDEIVRS